MTEYSRLLVLESTRNKFKIAAALNGESMISLLDRLVDGVLDGTIKVSTLPRPTDSDHVVPVFDVQPGSTLYVQERDQA